MKNIKMNPRQRERHNEALEKMRVITTGTVVDYWKGLKEGDPAGSGKVTVILMQPNNYGTDVVWIEGCSGCILISHIEIATDK